MPEKFCAAVEKLAKNIFISTPAHSEYAALASFELDNLESRRAEYGRRGEFLYQQLQRQGFDCATKPEGVTRIERFITK